MFTRYPNHKPDAVIGKLIIEFDLAPTFLKVPVAHVPEDGTGISLTLKISGHTSERFTAEAPATFTSPNSAYERVDRKDGFRWLHPG